MYKEYFGLALSSLGKRRLRSWLTMIGIFIGIAAVVSLISLGQGMQQAIAEQFFQLGVDKVTITTKGVQTGPPGSNTNIMLTTDDREAVERARGVEFVTGRLVEQVTIRFNDDERYPYLVSAGDTREGKQLLDEVAQVEIIKGRPLRLGDRWSVLIPEGYTDTPRFDGKSLRVGDKLDINGQQVDVVGVVAQTGNPFVDGSFQMMEEPVRDLLNEPEKYGMLVAQVDTTRNLDLTVDSIEKELRSERNVDEDEEDFEVQTAEEIMSSFETILNIVTGVLIGIASISLIVGGVGITNTMFTAVLERRREIGIMKAIGARNSDVLLIFLTEAGLLGLVGGVIGVAIGAGLAKGVELIAFQAFGKSLIEAHFPLTLVIGALLFGFVLGGLAGAVPAYRAGRLPPVEALRE